VSRVGYLGLRCFDDPELASDTAVAAMQLLSNTYGLIIDLRRNRGGNPGMIQLLATYLFGSEPVHLNDIYSRKSNSTQQFWTLPYVPGRRLTEQDIWILTSRSTFSAAEEFAYDLKSVRRATVVGETTGGGILERTRPLEISFLRSYLSDARSIRLPKLIGREQE
jgi:retinol-binding protein 3